MFLKFQLWSSFLVKIFTMQNTTKRWFLKSEHFFGCTFFYGLLYIFIISISSRFRSLRQQIVMLIDTRIHLPFCTAKTQYQKFETNIPRKGIARPQSQYPQSCVSQRFIYSHDWSAYSATGKYVDRSWKSKNRSQTFEYGNWDWGRAISFLGIHKWDFRCSVGAVFFN